MQISKTFNIDNNNQLKIIKSNHSNLFRAASESRKPTTRTVSEIYLTEKKSSAENDKSIQAIIKIQQNIRGYLARKPEDSFSKIQAIKDSKETLGWKINNHYIKKPVAILNKEELIEGGCKILTHRDSNSVLLTIKSPNLFMACSQFIEKKISGLTNIIPQTRVNKNQFFAPNLGVNDLFESLCKGNYQLNLDDFFPLIKQLEQLHEINIIHRDIKLENMFFLSDKKICLTDLDTMGEIGKFVILAGTPSIISNELLNNPNKYGVKLDKLAMLNSIIICYAKNHEPIDGRFSRLWVNGFVELYVIDEYQQATKNFLLNPRLNDIPKLSEILKFSQT